MKNLFERNAQSERYFLPSGYQERLEPNYCLNFSPILWQPQVYQVASFLGERFSCKSIIDLGCGTANKLVKLYPKFKIIGLDYGENLEYCKQNYPFGQWIEHDLDRPVPIPVHLTDLKSSIIICSDVIEHLKNPSALLNNLFYMLKHAPICIISTPDRDRIYGTDYKTPPGNEMHVREWNKDEFIKLLQYFKLNISYADWTINNEVAKQTSTILAIICNSNKELIANDDALKANITRIAHNQS